MKEAKLRKLILDITKGNLRYADPQDDICKEATARYDKDIIRQLESHINRLTEHSPYTIGQC